MSARVVVEVELDFAVGHLDALGETIAMRLGNEVVMGTLRTKDFPHGVSLSRIQAVRAFAAPVTTQEDEPARAIARPSEAE